MTFFQKIQYKVENQSIHLKVDPRSKKLSENLKNDTKAVKTRV